MMIKQILILAGGLGKRIKKLGYKSPKYLIKINEKNFADYQLSQLKKKGIKNVVMCTGYRSPEIKKYLKRGKRWGLKINYSEERYSLGTGGAIKNAILNNLTEDYFFLIYGDTYPLVNFRQISKNYFKFKKPVLMTVLKNLNKYDTSNVHIKNNAIKIYSKTKKNLKFIDYGVLILEKKYILKITNNIKKFDLSKIISKAVQQKMISANIVKTRFFEIGSENGIMNFENFIKKN